MYSETETKQHQCCDAIDRLKHHNAIIRLTKHKTQDI